MVKLDENEKQKVKEIVLASKTVTEAIKAGTKIGVKDRDVKRYWRRRDRIKRNVEKRKAMLKIQKMQKNRKDEDKRKEKLKNEK